MYFIQHFLHLSPLRFHLCRQWMLELNPGLLRFWHWQSEALTTLLDLIQNQVTSHPHSARSPPTRLYLIHTQARYHPHSAIISSTLGQISSTLTAELIHPIKLSTAEPFSQRNIIFTLFRQHHLCACSQTVGSAAQEFFFLNVNSGLIAISQSAKEICLLISINKNKNLHSVILPSPIGQTLGLLDGDDVNILIVFRMADVQQCTYIYKYIHSYIYKPPLLVQPALLVHSRLYWYRGITVLMPGWVIWK